MVTQADHIYIFKDGKPISIYLGNIYKNNSTYGLVDSRFHIAYEGNFYKFSDQFYDFKIESLRDPNDNTVIFKVTIEIYNPQGEYKYVINIFTTDKSTYWDYRTEVNIPEGEIWTVKIRDLDKTEYNYKDQFWKYRLSNNSVTV